MALPDLPAEGGCRCGALRVRVTRLPLLTVACHCRGCQRMTGSAFSLSAAFPDDGLEVLRGTTVAGGADPGYGHRFCPVCLSWVWTKSPRMEGFLNLRSSMLDDPSWVAPFAETWTAEKLPFAITGAARSWPAFPPMDDLPAILAAYADWARA